MHTDAERLFKLDETLRNEADDMLSRSGIGPILQNAGYQAVGSYAMKTMTWRDLDFEREEEPSWERHWEVGTQLAKTGWCARLKCVDVYREQWMDYGLYLELRVLDPSSPEKAKPGNPMVWNFDIWTARSEEYTAHPKRANWISLLTDETRAEVLAIKDKMHRLPEYKRTLLSIHIYEAVLEEGIRGVDDFMKWWKKKLGSRKS